MPISLIIDPEFEALLDRQSPAELEQLEQNLLAEGCRDTIKLWKGSRFILDGMTRYGLCLKHRIPFETSNVPCANRAAALEWIIRNQLGRRNLSAESRQRMVVALRKEGKSTREIAEVVKASNTTVIRDLKAAEAAGATFGAPEKVTGKDGKSYSPKRRIVASPVAGDAAEPPANGKLPRVPRTGKVKFDHKTIDKTLGPLARLIEAMGRAYGKHQHYKKCDQLGNELCRAVKDWHREAS